MEAKKFTMIDEEFVCEVCGTPVSPLNYTARDHCPNCLSSKHVDINPGDRACNCLGVLQPVGIEKGKRDTYKIIYRCCKCQMVKRNVAARDDNFDKILDIMSHSLDFPTEKANSRIRKNKTI
ncbi:MAG: RNHCP domain-containing protein [Bacilli bacterium]|nr:RNHCP domain-containing protein [Bacilli bacterium]